MPRRARISSACGVVGPLEASATMRALMASALCRVMTFSSAAGTRMSHFMVRDARSARHANNRGGALLVADGFDRIDATRVGYATAGIADGDDFRFLFGKNARGGGAGIAEALDGHAGPAEGDFFELARLFYDGNQPARRGFVASDRAPDGLRLAGDHAVSCAAHGHGIRIHDPGH